MSDGTFVEALKDAIRAPLVMQVDGKEVLMTPNNWSDRTPSRPSPKPITISTLTGLKDYLTEGIDGLDPRKLMLHVADPVTVELLSAIELEDVGFRRQVYAIAKAQPAAFPFGQHLDAERFMIGLQTAFVSTPETASLVTLLASIRESDVRETVDDGVAQEVKTMRGVAISDRTRVPNPVTLQPYRTFREIEQPTSKFVLRLKGGGEGRPACALFEADGGTWQIDAIRDIAAWLRTNLKGVAVIA